MAHHAHITEYWSSHSLQLNAVIRYSEHLEGKIVPNAKSSVAMMLTLFLNVDKMKSQKQYKHINETKL